MKSREAYVIGSGPNGLTAAIMLARAGLKTTVLEAQPTIGGGTRSAELTLPGFLHDVCSAVHPLAIGSPVFKSFPLQDHGLQWIQPNAPVAHPLDDGTAVMVERSVQDTAENLGIDGSTYARLTQRLVMNWDALAREILGPVLHVPHHPSVLLRFALLGAWSAIQTARILFRSPRTRAMFAGMASHSILPLEKLGSGAFGWVIDLSAHGAGWPVPKGGSQKIANALASHFESLGGTILVNTQVRSLNDLNRARTILADITPRQLIRIGAGCLPEGYVRELEGYRYGPGVFKMDWALNAPIPWKAHECLRAATIHIGGTLEEIAASERAAWTGSTVERPFMIVAQPSLFDSSRAPAGRHTAWAYCHVPNGSSVDMTERLESQIERFAPGFRNCILARHTMKPADLEQINPNLVGGDIGGGAANMRQLVFRPTPSLYRTPRRGLYLCSSSTPPGGGVHGMCGYHAAKMALHDMEAEP